MRKMVLAIACALLAAGCLDDIIPAPKALKVAPDMAVAPSGDGADASAATDAGITDGGNDDGGP
jgi:hypothetical protein